MPRWTHTGENEGDEWRRADGVRVVCHANGPRRPWAVMRGRDYLCGKLFAWSQTNDGAMRTFATAKAAMEAADKSWPVAAPAES